MGVRATQGTCGGYLTASKGWGLGCNVLPESNRALFFHGRLNAERYQQEMLAPFIEQLDEHELANGWFQQDGATAHIAYSTIEFLERSFWGREKSHNVVVDVDAGVDDAVALLMLLAADSIGEIKIHGITCTHGNTSVENVCTNVLRTLGAIGRLDKRVQQSSMNNQDVPVFRGAECALIPRETSAGDHLEHFHGLDGFGDLSFPHTPNKKLIQSENAINALNHTACNLSRVGSKLTLVCLAPLTNIALTLRTYPDFSKTLKEVYIMGGNSTGMGNITATGEFNFYSDPEAAHIVLSTLNCPIYLLPWETCLAVDIPMDWRFGVLGRVQTPHMELLNAVEKKVWERSNYNKWFPCDAILAALMLKPDIIVNSRLCHVLVELHGRHTRGQVVIDHLQTHEPNVFLVEKINVELLKKMLLWMAGCKESEFNPFRVSKVS